MYYGKINPLDIANGPGIRVSLFVSGCRNRCKGCFNPETWDFNYGEEFTHDTLSELSTLLDNPNVEGLSILGGDPFEPENIECIEYICEYVRRFHIDRTIWVWTGYLFEDLKKLPVMQNIDVLVDGRFEEDLKDLRLPYRGSSNQRVINVWASLKNKKVVEWKPEE